MRDVEYLGDAVYVYIDDGDRLWLKTSDGLHDTNQICLEPEVLQKLLEYLGVKQ